MYRLSVVSERVERALVLMVRIVGVTLALAILVVPVVRIVPGGCDDPIEDVTPAEVVSRSASPPTASWTTTTGGPSARV